MPFLYNTKCRDRQRIMAQFYPFQKANSIEGMIIGNDLDSLLSAALLKELFDWDIMGVYDYKTLWFDEKLDRQFFQKIKTGVYIAVDLDIYRNSIPSVGHHILQYNANDCLKKHIQSLNPNFIFGIDCQTFALKYPLGTIHFLRWLFQAELDRRGELLCWLADSSYINAQSHRFRENVAHWLYIFFDWHPFWEIFILLDTEEYEKLLVREIGSYLDSITKSSRNGQVKSRYKRLSGWQCQWKDPNKQRQQILEIFDLVHRICGWQIPSIPVKFASVQGIRKNSPIATILYHYNCLDTFLQRERIFSYAFTYSDQINFTVFPADGAIIY